MNCKNCGSPLVPEDKFCKLCGTPVQKNNNVGMPTNPQKPAPMPNQPMNSAPTPIKVNEAPTPVKVNGPMGPGPVKPMNQPMANQGPKPNHGMNLGETQVLGTVTGVKPNNGMPGNKPNGMVANNVKPMPLPPKPTPAPVPAPVPGMPMSNGPVAPEPEGKGGAMKVVLIILLILGLAVGGYFGYKALSNDDGDDPESDPVVANTKKVDFGGYTFDIPTKFMVKTEQGMLNVDDGSFGFYMSLVSYSYSQVAPTQVVTNYTNQGFTAEYKGEKEYSGTKYHLFVVQQGGESVYVVYVSLGASKLLALTIYNNPSSVLPTQGNVDEALKVGLSGTYTGANNLEKEGIEKLDPRSFLVEGEAKSAGDVAEYTEEVVYADVTVEEVY